MSQAHMGIDPDLLGVRTSKGHVLRHFAQQLCINRCAIEINNANNAAHDPLAHLLFLRVNLDTTLAAQAGASPARYTDQLALQTFP